MVLLVSLQLLHIPVLKPYNGYTYKQINAQIMGVLINFLSSLIQSLHTFVTQYNIH